MKDYLKKYQACLKATGPVFIGSGREITKKEYLLLRGGSQIGVLDMPAFYSFLGKRHLQHKFDDFLLYDSRSDLRNWLRNQKISFEEVKPFFRYILNTGEIEMQRKTQIMEFVKDPYGCPYVPGSSLKGMFRTILLAGKILDDPDNFTNEINGLCKNIPSQKRRDSYLHREIQQIENTAFHTLNRPKSKPWDAVNDALSGFIVSDSEPLELSSLILCQKYDRNPEGIEKTLPLMRECLKPGTEIRFTITIDERLIPLNAQEIMDDVNAFLNVYNKDFLSKFEDVDQPEKNTVYLGGGAGFATKTVDYPMLGEDDGIGAIADIFKNTGVPLKHKHEQDRKLGVSPHMVKLTRYQGKSYQMGQCRLSIEQTE